MTDAPNDIPPGINPEYTHHLAIHISRHLNHPVPNDLLARNITQIALAQPGPKSFISACSAFGRYPDDFLTGIYREIKERGDYDRDAKPAGNAAAAKARSGFAAAERDSGRANNLPGGLLVSSNRPKHTEDGDHPAKKESKLGLDRLAKRIKLDLAAQGDTEEEEVRNVGSARKEQTGRNGHVEFKKPALPQQRNIRERRMDTPTVGPGISREAAERLAAHKRNRQFGRDERTRGVDQRGPYNRDNRDGYNRDGHNWDGYNRDRNNRGGSNRDGYNRGHDGYRPQPGHSGRPRHDPTPVRNSERFANARPNTARSSRLSTPRIPDKGDNENYIGINEADSSALDRDWYASDELGHAYGDETHNPFGSAENTYADQLREQAFAEKKAAKRISARAQQRMKDVDAWETNRMLTSGVAQRADVDTMDFDDEEETRVHLLVHDLKPPFLDGRRVFTKQLEPVPAIRDPQSDMAVFSKKGSMLVKERRLRREREKQAQEATSMAGTTLGAIVGVKEDDTDSAAPEPGPGGSDVAGEKGSSKFAEHLKQSEGASNFSRSKTLQEQRQYLPAFAVREELMSVIRDNQGTFVDSCSRLRVRC